MLPMYHNVLLFSIDFKPRTSTAVLVYEQSCHDAQILVVLNRKDA